ncbi:Heat shock protein 70kD C-terminal domain, partial [Trinorchestia longiramus]
EEFEHRQKEVEKVCRPVITKLYGEAGGPTMPGGSMPSEAAGGPAGGPTIEEVD